MWEKLFNLAISNGIWAVLFLGLLVYQLKDSRARERKYQQTIDSTVKALDIINDIKSDVEEIKQNLIYTRKSRRTKDETTTQG